MPAAAFGREAPYTLSGQHSGAGLEGINVERQLRAGKPHPLLITARAVLESSPYW